MLKNKHWQIQSTILEMAQVAGFFKRVYKIYKFWQLEDVNLTLFIFRENILHFPLQEGTLEHAKAGPCT